jgi:hypothetical protein
MRVMRSPVETKASGLSSWALAGEDLRQTYRALLRVPHHPAVGRGLDARVAFIQAELKLLTDPAGRIEPQAGPAIDLLMQEGLSGERELQECQKTGRLARELFHSPEGAPVPPRELRRRIASAITRESAPQADSALQRLARSRGVAIDVDAQARQQRVLDIVMTCTVMTLAGQRTEDPSQRKALQRMLGAVFREDEARLGVSRGRIRALHDLFCDARGTCSGVQREAAWLALMNRRWRSPESALLEVARLQSSPAWSGIPQQVRFAPVLGAMDVGSEFDAAAAARILEGARADMSRQDRSDLLAKARAAGEQNARSVD